MIAGSKTLMRRTADLLGGLLLMALVSVAAADEPAGGATPIAELQRTEPVSFSKEIVPLLRQNCVACHNASKAESELALDTVEAMLKGGAGGTVVVPAKSGESRLLAIAAGADEPVMPPTGNKVGAQRLTSEQLGLLKRWIDEGAKADNAQAQQVAWQPLPLGVQPVLASALSPDGQFAVCSRANQIFVYHLPTAALVTRLTDPALLAGGVYSQPGVAHLDLVQAVAFSPDGFTLASAGYREVKLWQRPRAKVVAETATGVAKPTAVAASADGNWLALAGEDLAIRLVRRSDGQATATLAGHTGRVTSLAFTPDATQLVSAAADRSVRSWNVAGGAVVGQTSLAFEPTALALASSGAVIGGAGGELLTLPLPAKSPFALARSGAATMAAALSPDGTLMALAREDFQIELRDFSTGGLKQLCRGGSANVRAMAFTPDGARLAAGGDDGRVSLYSSADGALLDAYDTGAAVTSLVLTPDGSQILIGGADGQVGIWRAIVDSPVVASPRLEVKSHVAALAYSGKLLATDGLLDGKPAMVLRDVADGRLIRHLTGAAVGTTALTFSRDDALLAAAGLDGSVQVWNLNDGALAHTIAGPAAPVTALLFAETPGQLLLGGDDGALRLVNLADGVVAKQFAGHTRSIVAVQSAPNGEFWSVAADQTLRRWRWADGAALATSNTQGTPAALAVAADGSRVIVGARARTAEMFSASGQRQGIITLFDGPIRSLHASSDGSRLVAAGGVGHIAVADLEAGAVIERLPLVSPATFLFPTADPNAVMVGAPDQSWQVRQRRLVRRLPTLGSPVRSLALSADGATLFTSAMAGQIRRETLAASSPSLVISHDSVWTSLALSPDGSRLAAGDERGRVTFWNAETLQPQFAAQAVASSAVTRLAFAPDGKWLAVGSRLGSLLTVDAATGAVIHDYRLHAGELTQLGVRADGVWTAALDGMVWQTPLTPARLLPKHAAAVTAIELSADGANLLSASRDGLVRLADFATGQEKGKQEIAAPITALAIRKDGALAAAGTASGTGRIWKLADGAVVADLKGDPAARREVDRWTALTTVAQTKTAAAKEALDVADKEVVARTEAVPKAEQARATASTEAEPAKQAAVAAAEALAASAKTADEAAAALTAATGVQAEAGKALEAVTAVAKLAQDASAAAKKSQEVLAMAHEATTAAVSTATTALASKPDDAALAAAKAAAEQAQVQATAALAAAQGAATASDQILALRNTAVAEATAKKSAADQAQTAAAAASQAAAEAKAAAEKKSTELAAAAKAATDKLTAADAALLDAQRSLQLARDAQGLAKGKHDATVSIEQQNAAHSAAATAAAAATQSPWRSVAFVPDSRLLAVLAENGRLHRFDAVSGAAVETSPGPAAAVWLAAMPEGRQQVLHGDGVLRTWQAGGDWTLAGRIGPAGSDPLDVGQSPLIDRVLSLAFSPDGQLLATGGGEPSRSGELKVWNVADGALRLNLPDAHSDTVFGVDFSADGRYLASAAADKFVKVFDLVAGAQVRSFEGHTHHVLSVGWRFDGTLLASSGADKVIKIWNFDSGEQQRTIQGFNKEATSVHFVGTSGLTLTSSGDKTLRLHNADDGKSPRSFSGSDEFLHTAAVTPDGKLVAAGGQDGILRLWNGEDGKLLINFNPPDAAAANQQAAK